MKPGRKIVVIFIHSRRKRYLVYIEFIVKSFFYCYVYIFSVCLSQTHMVVIVMQLSSPLKCGDLIVADLKFHYQKYLYALLYCRIGIHQRQILRYKCCQASQYQTRILSILGKPRSVLDYGNWWSFVDDCSQSQPWVATTRGPPQVARSSYTNSPMV